MSLIYRAIPYLLLLGVIMGVVWLIHDAGKDAGFSAGQADGYNQGQSAGFNAGKIQGNEEGYKRGVADTQKLNDQETLRVMAEYRAEAEQVKREAAEDAKRQEERDRARIEFARTAYTTAMRRLDADFKLLRERVRRAEARSALRLPGDPSRLPEATAIAIGSAPSFTDWLVSEGGGGRILRVAEAGETVNGGLDVCWSAKAEQMTD